MIASLFVFLLSELHPILVNLLGCFLDVYLVSIDSTVKRKYLDYTVILQNCKISVKIKCYHAIRLFSDLLHFFFICFVPGSSHNKVLFLFNLTSMPESEVILSASLHFLRPQSRLRPLNCRRSRGPLCHSQHLQPSTPVKLILRGMSQNTTFPPHLGNITLPPLKKGHWQMSDLSSVVQWARARNELIISVEFDFGERPQWQQDRLTPHTLPYILIFANDLTINEPNSIALSLQRYSPVGEDKGNRPPIVTSSSRIRRAAEQLQNFLPNVQYDDQKNKELWYNTYFALKPKTLSKGQGGRQGPEVSNGGSRTQELSFDKRTMKKARRKQWSEPRVCTSRYLRVDFADIGWSEWILAPKAFDAFYCAGTCGFPMPKVR